LFVGRDVTGQKSIDPALFFAIGTRQLGDQGTPNAADAGGRNKKHAEARKPRPFKTRGSMPNWCECDLYVEGASAKIDEFLQLVKSEESDFDFDRLIPYPEHFKKLYRRNSGGMGQAPSPTEDR